MRESPPAAHQPRACHLVLLCCSSRRKPLPTAAAATAGSPLCVVVRCPHGRRTACHAVERDRNSRGATSAFGLSHRPRIRDALLEGDARAPAQLAPERRTKLAAGARGPCRGRRTACGLRLDGDTRAPAQLAPQRQTKLAARQPGRHHRRGRGRGRGDRRHGRGSRCGRRTGRDRGQRPELAVLERVLLVRQDLEVRRRVRDASADVSGLDVLLLERVRLILRDLALDQTSLCVRARASRRRLEGQASEMDSMCAATGWRDGVWRQRREGARWSDLLFEERRERMERRQRRQRR